MARGGARNPHGLLDDRALPRPAVSHYHQRMKLKAGVTLVLGVVGAFAACGESDQDGRPAVHDQGGEPAGGADGVPTMTAAGVGGDEASPSAGAGAEPSGGVPSSGGAGGEVNVPAAGGAAGEMAIGDVGGAGGAGDGGAGGAAGDAGYLPVTCSMGSPSIAAGVLNGKGFSSPMKGAFAGSINIFNEHFWNLTDALGNDGLAVVWGTTTYYDASVKMPSDGQGDLRLPTGAPLAGEHLCAGKSDAMEGGYSTPPTVHFRELSTLGKCPATAGAGSLSGCFEETAPGAAVACDAYHAHIKGTVGTTTVDEQWFINFGASRYSDTRVAMAFGHGGLLDAELGDGGGGELIFPSDSTVLPGVVVCVGVSHVTTKDLGASYVFTLGELGSLGACPGAPVTGFIDACY